MVILFGGPFRVNSPGHVAEHNRLAGLLPDGTVPATLDSSGLLPESQVPVRLTDTSLNAVYAMVDSPLGPKRIAPGGLVDSRVLSTFAEGHGWTIAQSGTNTAAEDTTMRGPFSDRSIKIVMGATLPAIDFTAGPIVVWFHFADGQAGPQGFEVRIADDTFANGYAFPVYPKTPATENVDGWTALEIYPDGLSMVTLGTPAALTAIRIRPYANSTVWVGGISQRNNSTAFPNGVITLRFDDGYSSQHDLAMPSLAKYGYSGYLAMIIDRVGVTGAPTIDQLREMRDRAGWEIGAHAFTTADHDARFDTLTPDQVAYDLQSMKAWLTANGFDTSVWTSPGGVSNVSIWAEARKYFTAHLGVSGNLTSAAHMGAWQSPRPAYPAHIASSSFDTTAATVASMQTVIADVKTNKSWAVLTFHAVLPSTSPSDGNQINVTDLETLLATIQSAGIPVRTPNQVLAAVA